MNHDNLRDMTGEDWFAFTAITVFVLGIWGVTIWVVAHFLSSLAST